VRREELGPRLGHAFPQAHVRKVDADREHARFAAAELVQEVRHLLERLARLPLDVGALVSRRHAAQVEGAVGFYRSVEVLPLSVTFDHRSPSLVFRFSVLPYTERGNGERPRLLTGEHGAIGGSSWLSMK